MSKRKLEREHSQIISELSRSWNELNEFEKSQANQIEQMEAKLREKEITEERVKDELTMLKSQLNLLTQLLSKSLDLSSETQT